MHLPIFLHSIRYFENISRTFTTSKRTVSSVKVCIKVFRLEQARKQRGSPLTCGTAAVMTENPTPTKKAIKQNCRAAIILPNRFLIVWSMLHTTGKLSKSVSQILVQYNNSDIIFRIMLYCLDILQRVCYNVYSG